MLTPSEFPAVAASQSVNIKPEVSIPEPPTLPSIIDFMPKPDPVIESMPIPEIDIPIPEIDPGFESIPFPEVGPIVPDMPPIPEAPKNREPSPAPAAPSIPNFPRPEVSSQQDIAPFPVEVFPPEVSRRFPKPQVAPEYEKSPDGTDGRFLDESLLPPAEVKKPLDLSRTQREAGFTSEDSILARDKTGEDVAGLDAIIRESETRRQYEASQKRQRSAETGSKVASGIGRAQGAVSIATGAQQLAEAETSYDAFKGGLQITSGVGDVSDIGPLNILGDAASFANNALTFSESPENRAQAALGMAQDATSATLRASQYAPALLPAGSMASNVATKLGPIGAGAELIRGGVSGAYDTSAEAKSRTTAENIGVGMLTGDATVGGASLTGAANAFGANIQQGGVVDAQLAAGESQLRGASIGAAIGTFVAPGPGTAVGAVAGQAVGGAAELYKSGSAYAREASASAESQNKTDRMLEESKSKDPNGLDVLERTAIQTVAVLTKEASSLRELQSKGQTTYEDKPIEEAISDRERGIINNTSTLQNSAVQKANDENWTMFDLGPDSPIVKAKLNKYQSLVGTAIEELGSSLSNEINPGSLPSPEVSLPSNNTPVAPVSYRPTTNKFVDDVDYSSTGGLIYASRGTLVNYKPRGTDTVPAMLTPGEFVVNAKAAQNNLSLLRSINSNNYMAGGRVAYLAGGTSKETPEERAARLQKIKEDRLARAQETPEEKAARLQKIRDTKLAERRKALKDKRDAEVKRKEAIIARGKARGEAIEAARQAPARQRQAQAEQRKRAIEISRKEGISPQQAMATMDTRKAPVAAGGGFVTGNATVGGGVTIKTGSPQTQPSGGATITTGSTQQGIPQISPQTQQRVGMAAQAAFDPRNAGDMNKQLVIFGTLLTGVNQVMTQFGAVMQQLVAGGGQAGGGVNNSGQGTPSTDGISQFTTTLNNFVNQLQKLNIPPEIKISISQTKPIDVNINGADALQQLLNGPLGDMIKNRVKAALNQKDIDDEKPPGS
jgi:hypothetical protein